MDDAIDLDVRIVEPQSVIRVFPARASLSILEEQVVQLLAALSSH
jgi:hypothetical protein